MDLSDDDLNHQANDSYNDNLTIITNPNETINESIVLEPPPPLPDLPDDADANNFLDDLDKDLNSNEFLEQEEHEGSEFSGNNYMQRPPLLPLGYENAPTGIWNNIPPPPSMPPNLCNILPSNMGSSMLQHNMQPNIHGNISHSMSGSNMPPNMSANISSPNISSNIPPNSMPALGNMMVNNLEYPPNMNEMPMESNNWNDNNWNENNWNENWNENNQNFRGRNRGNWAHGEFTGRGRGNRNFRGARGHNRGSPRNWNNRGGRPFHRGNFKGGNF